MLPQRKRKQYSDEFKKEAVALVNEKRNFSAVAKQLGICVGTLENWHRDISFYSFDPVQLQIENSQLRTELESLKSTIQRLLHTQDLIRLGSNSRNIEEMREVCEQQIAILNKTINP